MMKKLAFIQIMLLLLCSPVYAQRIISLYPGHTDNIVALGGEESLIALSENDDLLPDLPRIPINTGAERILALSPDVVVTRSFAERLNPNLYEILRVSGVRVLSLDPPDWEDFQEYLKTLAHELNLDSDSAIEKLNQIRKDINTQAQSIKRRPRVFIEATSRELHTCAPDSWAANLIALCGGENIASEAKPLRSGSSIAAFGLERILENLESIDIYIIQTGAMNHTTLQEFHKRHWIAGKPATRANAIKRVYIIPEKYLSRPSLLGLESGAKMLLDIFTGE